MVSTLKEDTFNMMSFFSSMSERFPLPRTKRRLPRHFFPFCNSLKHTLMANKQAMYATGCSPLLKNRWSLFWVPQKQFQRPRTRVSWHLIQNHNDLHSRWGGGFVGLGFCFFKKTQVYSFDSSSGFCCSSRRLILLQYSGATGALGLCSEQHGRPSKAEATSAPFSWSLQ